MITLKFPRWSDLKMSNITDESGIRVEQKCKVGVM